MTVESREYRALQTVINHDTYRTASIESAKGLAEELVTLCNDMLATDYPPGANLSDAESLARMICHRLRAARESGRDWDVASQRLSRIEAEERRRSKGKDEE